ncbi:hypothetical protein PVK06_020647 [Gossypium arboreum]|uniref:Uncharacterized protein n=1 Tax=Gossypium arboreum TaxID=29729 RepID=A0ABR0PMX3_GOSAR|nr:hypothetical protein PVK06_020647 [Gossypium arboreum]
MPKEICPKGTKDSNAKGDLPKWTKFILEETSKEDSSQRICLIKSWTKVDEQIRIVQPRQPSVESCLSRNLSERWLFLVETHNSSKPFKISMKPSR